MTLNQQLAIQIALTAIQFLTPVFFPLTPSQDSNIHGFVSAVQTILAAAGHFYNPDGSKSPKTTDPLKP